MAPFAFHCIDMILSKFVMSFELSTSRKMALEE